MRKKVLIVYGIILFILFAGVGILARQWWVGADINLNLIATNSSNVGFGDLSWLTNCSQCPNGINVICDSTTFSEGGENDGDMGYANGCSITMPTESCNMHGLVTSNNVSTSLLAGKLDCSGITNSDQADRCCTLVHELSHSCDPANNARIGDSCSEVFAQQNELLCRNTIDSRLCSDEGEQSSESCRSVCHISMSRATEKVWNACMCNEASQGIGVDGGTCCGCNAECKNVERVKKFIPQFCIDKYSYFLSYINYYCDAHSTSGHNCDYHLERTFNNLTGQYGESNCPGGTGFNPNQCSQYRSNCYLPQNETEDKGLMNSFCKETFGEEFILNKIFQTEPEGIHNCTLPFVDRSMGYSCIKSTCNLNTSSQGSIGITSSASASKTLLEKVSAAAPITGVTIKAQKNRGPYSVTDNAIHNLGKTGDDGRVKAGLLIGTWKITAEKEGYQSQTKTLVVTKDRQFSLNFDLVSNNHVSTPTPNPVYPSKTPVVTSGTLNVYVVENPSVGTLVNNAPRISGAKVTIKKANTIREKNTDSRGLAGWLSVGAGNWSVKAEKVGYTMWPEEYNISINQNSNNVYIIMKKAGADTLKSGVLSIYAVESPPAGTPIANAVKISGAKITIQKARVIKTKNTNKEGLVSWTSVGVGSWSVKAEKTGYRMWPTDQSVVVNQVSNTAYVILQKQ